MMKTPRWRLPPPLLDVHNVDWDQAEVTAKKKGDPDHVQDAIEMHKLGPVRAGRYDLVPSPIPNWRRRQDVLMGVVERVNILIIGSELAMLAHGWGPATLMFMFFNMAAVVAFHNLRRRRDRGRIYLEYRAYRSLPAEDVEGETHVSARAMRVAGPDEDAPPGH